MNEWVDECNFAASGALLARSERLPLSETSGSSSSAASSTSLTPTPAAPLTPQEPVPAPSFEAFLTVLPACTFQSTRSRSEAAVVFEIAGVALEMDVLVESVREQLHDRRRVCEWLRAAELGKAATGAMDTALLVLQQQARDVTEHNVRQLLASFQTRLETLAELQSIESGEASARELAVLSDTETAMQRRQFVAVQTTLLERLRTLQTNETVPAFTSHLGTSAQLQSRQSAVCWPAASHHSDLSSGSSSGQMHSPLSTLSALDERRLMDAEDPNVTLTGHHETTYHGTDDGSDQERQTQDESDGVAGGQRSEAVATPASQPGARESHDHDSASKSSAGSDHALSESVY